MQPSHRTPTAATAESAASPPSSSSSQQPALQAVQHVCRLLRGYGITHLTPELLRQAKFDAPQSCGPLLLALHDLVLVVAAGLPSGCAAALQRLKLQLQRESLDAASCTLTEQGRLLLLHCLSAWGCPHGLVAQLAVRPPSSKSALLALAWLIGHAQLFEAALQQAQQLPLERLLPLLPPYPEDTCLTPESQQRRAAAAAAAQQHSERVQQLVCSQEAAATGGGACASGSWAAVHTAAQHVLSTYRAASLRLQQLTALQEGREKLLHAIQEQQRQAGSASPVLSAFELHLLAHPQLLQQHQQALQQACDLLQQQQRWLQHAQTFFAWAASAVGGAQQGAAAAAVAGLPASPPRPNGTAPGPAVADVMPLVQQLPAADSQLAGSVLGKVTRQLEQAAAAAGMPVPRQLDGDTLSSGFGAPPTLQQAVAAGLAGLSLQPEAPQRQHSRAADGCWRGELCTHSSRYHGAGKRGDGRHVC